MDTAADRGPAHAAHAPVPPGPGSRVDPAQLETHEMSFLEPLERVLASLRRMARNYALLAILDLRRASVQLAWLIASGIFISVLVVTAWLALVIALAVVLFGKGMSWPGVLCVAAAVNVAGAAVVVWRVRHVFDHAPFAATMRQLKADDPDEKNKS